MKKAVILGSLSWQGLRLFAGDIKIAHSIFALPFVFGSLLFLPLRVSWLQIVWIVCCMVTARSFAMGMNRFLDREGDAKNPRTASRMIPSGRLHPRSSLAWSLLFGLLFCLCSLQLNFLAGLLSPLLLCILGVYPLMKKITCLTHWYLGFCLGLSPIAASFALGEGLALEALLIGLAVMLWTGGFDVIYALQDWEFDRKFGFISFPVKFGVKTSLVISRLSFLSMVLCLTLLGIWAKAGSFYYLGILVIAGILSWEHILVRDSIEGFVSKNINKAFFSVNAWVGVVFYIFTLMDVCVDG